MRLKNLLPILALLAACSAAPTGNLSGSQSGGPTAGSSPSQPATTQFVFTQPADIQPAPTITLAASLASPVASPLVLTILSPLNESVVGEAQVNLTGSVSRQAVLTINDAIYLLPAGDFSIPIMLEEGPNLLEIVASDTDGNETDLILVVTYQP